jgi:DNA polymerase-3 subunit gamma/tau
MADVISHLRNLLVLQCDPHGVSDELSAEAIAQLAEQSERITRDRLLELIEQFAAAEGRMKWAPNKKMHFEVAAIRAIQTLNQATLTEVLEALTALRNGDAPAPATRSRPAENKGPKPAARIEPEPLPPTAAPRMSLSASVAASLAETKPAPVPSPVAAPRVAEETPPAPQPPAAPANPVLSAGELWPQVLGRVRKERPLIQAWIEAGELVEIKGDVAILGFPPDKSLARESCDRANNRKFLEAVLSDIAGCELTIRVEEHAGLVPEKIALPELKPEAPHDPIASFKDDPLIRKALEEFKAEIIPA